MSTPPAARVVRAKDRTVYIGEFSSKDPGWFAGLAQQAGGRWWSINGDAKKVGINDDATKKVADFWGGLVKEGAVDTQAQWTPEWNAALDNGKLLSWASAVWAPGVLVSNAPNGKGKWAMAPLPQLERGQQASDFWQQATSISVTARGFTFGPNVNVAYSTYKDAFDKAVQSKSSLAS